MEILIAPELEARVADSAAKRGKDTSGFIEDVLRGFLDGELEFLDAVEQGILAADRGEFVEEQEMDVRVAAMLRH